MKIFLDKEHRVLEVCFGKDPTLIMSYDEEDGLCIENLADGDKIEIIERKLRFEITDEDL